MKIISSLFKKNAYTVLATLTGTLFVIVTIHFVLTFIAMKQRGDFHIHTTQRPLLVAENIKGWMTFGYINEAFNLPSDYLQSSLAITNKEYPNITLRKVADSKKVDRGIFTTQVIESIKHYSDQPAILKTQYGSNP